jgi:hypothetical protein
MVENQHDDGGLIGTKSPRTNKKGKRLSEVHEQYMYEHGIATFALADACAAAVALGRPPDERYAEALEKAVDFIYQNQHDDGGWRYTPKLAAPSDVSVSGWQVLALKSAKEAGMHIREDCIEKVRRFFKERETGRNGQTTYMQGREPTDSTTGVGMLARQFLLDEARAPLVGDAAKYLADRAVDRWDKPVAKRGHSDYYLWYNGTLAMFQAGGDLWQQWNNVVRDSIIELQRHGTTCERGSWDPDRVWANKGGGRIYSTALAVLCLEVYYRYTPQNELRPAGAGASGGVRTKPATGTLPKPKGDEGHELEKPKP